MLWLKLFYAHKECYRKPRSFIIHFLQLFYIDCIIVVRNLDDGHGVTETRW